MKSERRKWKIKSIHKKNRDVFYFMFFQCLVNLLFLWKWKMNFVKIVGLNVLCFVLSFCVFLYNLACFFVGLKISFYVILVLFLISFFQVFTWLFSSLYIFFLFWWEISNLLIWNDIMNFFLGGLKIECEVFFLVYLVGCRRVNIDYERRLKW